MTATSQRRVHALPEPDLSEAALAAVTEEVAATAAECDRTGAIPERGLRAAHRAGLLTATVAQRYGGFGAGPRDTARILIALGAGDPSVALIAANTLAAHAAHAAQGHWPEELYDQALARSVAEPAPINAIRAEPELGAPARGGLPKTTAIRAESGWTLHGRKAYATGGEALAFHTVWAIADEPGGDPQSPRVGHLIVPADLPGISWVDTWDHLGLRASNTHDVIYDGLELPATAFVEIPRGSDGAYRDPAATTAVGGFGHSAIYIGVAQAARTAFATFAHARVPAALGRPIATTERIQSVAGEIDLQIAQAETLLHGAVLRAEEDDSAFLPQLSVIKVAIARSVVSAVQTAVASLGNPGLSRNNSLERHLRDVLCVRVHPPPEDTAVLAAGKRVLGT